MILAILQELYLPASVVAGLLFLPPRFPILPRAGTRRFDKADLQDRSNRAGTFPRSDLNFTSRLQSWQASCFYPHVSPFSRGREPADLTRLISKIVQIEPELFQGLWNNDLNINPVIVSRFFFNGRCNRKGGLHNLFVSWVTNTHLGAIPNSLTQF